MAEREPAPGDVLGGRYEIQAELGRGGMATVYRGRDLRLHRRVAVKVFRDAFAESVDPQRRTQEMQLLAAVNHPSVVSVLDASTGDGVFGAYLVMELVTGDDLGALLHRARGPLAADFARRIVADVASALQALHDRGVVHRDVKPANILVPSSAVISSATVAAKLTDFGIAQLVDGAAMTAPETILGTAAYLSPEQVRGAPPRPASDVYSLGLVLLEALSGQRAFPGAAAEAAMARLHRPPAMPTDASPALAELLSRMTALDPAHRPAAGEVATALREQLAGRVTAPDATTTAPTPIAGIRAAAPVPAAPAGVDHTAPHEPLFTPSRGMPITSGTPAINPGRPSRKLPAVLAVAASVLAAAIAGVAISAAAGTDPATRTPPPAAAQQPEAPVASDEPVDVQPTRDVVTKQRKHTSAPASSKPARAVSKPPPVAPTTAPTATTPPPTSPPPAEPTEQPSEEPAPTSEPPTTPPTTDPAPTTAPSDQPSATTDPL